ncbi:MAG: ferrous iron transporter B [Phycisphaerales bacterium]
MTTVSGDPRESAAAAETEQPRARRALRVALLGNPNTGKTTLFNRLTGLRHKTSNFPGTTLEARVGRLRTESAAPGEDAPRALGLTIDLVDLPGVYSLELDQLEAEICRGVLEGRTAPRGLALAEPDALCVVADATNLARNLVFVGEAVRRRLPAVVALNMIDLARRHGIHIDPRPLEEALGCAVVPISARTGEGLDALERALGAARLPHTPPGEPRALRAWAEALYETAAAGEPSLDADSLTDRLDRVFTHPVLGVVCFFAVMAGLFYGLFTLAQYPMAWIDSLFAVLGSGTRAVLPAGPVADLLAEGVVAGIAATLVFVPQIALLFFLISILEDTGYLARAAFVVDRLLRPFGLPGHAFVPLLSSHACALPGIMATRAIPDRRERLATILVAPFMTCSARLPVYVLVTTVLFRDRPLLAALAFVGCYALGMLAGVLSALVARRTILRGRSRPMALELPSYKMPGVGTALHTTWDRVRVFLKQAGTAIVAISIVLWWLGEYPHVDPPERAAAMRAEAGQAREMAAALGKEGGDLKAQAEAALAGARAMEEEADRLERVHAKSSAFVGRIGSALQPVFEPLGYDRQLTIGVLASFAAREVFVSTMAVVVAGEEDAESEGVLERLAGAERDDGTPVFTAAVGWSLLVYYVLAMQCLPTLAVTAREAGGIRWAVLQLVWMSGMAYVAAAAVYWLLK